MSFGCRRHIHHHQMHMRLIGQYEIGVDRHLVPLGRLRHVLKHASRIQKISDRDDEFSADVSNSLRPVRVITHRDGDDVTPTLHD